MVEHVRPRTAEIIYNPGAGASRKKAQLVMGAEQHLRERGWIVHRRRTERPRHATELARDAANRGVDVVFAMGGDGTVNEVAKGLIYSKTALGVLPQGTVNVFAREAGIPKNPPKAIDMLLDGQIHTMDAARLQFLDGKKSSHEFFLMAGIGYDGLVFNAVQKPGRKRKKSGQGVYFREAIKQLGNADTPSAKLVVDGKEIAINHFSQMWINNTQNVAFLNLREDARADDGKLAVTVFDGRHKGPKRNILSLGKDLVLKLMGRRRPAKQERQIQAEKLSLKLDKPLFAEIDGEPIGSGKEIEIVVLKNALNVLTPKATDFFVNFGSSAGLMPRRQLGLAA